MTGVSKDGSSAGYSYTDDRLTGLTSPSGAAYGFRYNTLGQTAAVTVGSRSLITNQYAADTHYLSAAIYGNGHRADYTYDAFGRTASVTYDGDAAKRVAYVYDADGNLGLMTDGLTGRSTKYLYDLSGRPIGYNESGAGCSASLRTAYDARGNVSQTVQTLDEATYTTAYTYDADNRLTGSTQGQVGAAYTYDALGRMTALTGKNGSGSVVSTAIAYQDLSGTATTSRVRTWTNTAGGAATAYTYTYDQRGNILSVKEGTKTTTYVYDAKDQLVRENNQAAGKTWTYAYDAGGNLQTRKEYAYATGTLGAVRDAVTYTYGDSTWRDLLTAYDGAAISYDEIGNPLQDGTWTYTWQRGRQLSSMAAEGRWEKLRQWVEEASPEDPHVPKPSSPDGEPKRMVRITEYRRQDHAYSYDYDAGGNRLAQTETVTTTLRQDRQVYWSAPTPLLPPGGGGSAMGTGNMAQGGDDGGVSVNVVGSGFVSHSTVTEEAVTTRYFYSGGTLTDIRHPDYTMHFTYDAAGPATVTYNGTVYYYLRNAQGDVTGLVNAAGQKVVTYTYDAWGNPLTATGAMAATLGKDNPLRYRGYVYDTETGLYYLKSRYYSPERGRFINADGYVSTGQGLLGSNMFAYCNNNPIAMRDTEGRYPTYNTMMADNGRGGSGSAPKRSTTQNANTVKTIGLSIVKSVGDTAIGLGIEKALTPKWVHSAPLQVPLKYLKYSDHVAKVARGVGKVAGVVSGLLLAYDIYKDVRDYSGWNLVGAIAFDVAGLGIPIAILALTSSFLTPAGGVVAAIAIGIPLDFGIQYAKNHWLRKKEA